MIFISDIVLGWLSNKLISNQLQFFIHITFNFSSQISDHLLLVLLLIIFTLLLLVDVREEIYVTTDRPSGKFVFNKIFDHF